MKKVFFWFAVIALSALVVVYVSCLFAAWNNIPVWRVIVSILCCILSVIAFMALLFSLHINNISELLSGFKFEMLQIALISSLLSFVIITV